MVTWQFFPVYLIKLWSVVQSLWKSYLKQSNDTWQGIVRNPATGYPKSISGWKSDSQSKLNRIRDTLPTILNDNSTIGLPIFLGDDHPRKLHGSVNFDWYWYIFNWVNKNITEFLSFMNFGSRMTKFQNSVLYSASNDI